MILETAIARRGAGGGFVTLGVLEEHERGFGHWLGAAIVAFAAVAYSGAYTMFHVFFALWYLFTKPTPHWCFRCIDHPNQFMRAFWYLGACVRMALCLPFVAAVYLSVHGFAYSDSLQWFQLLAVLPLPYYVGGILQRQGKIRDAVEFGEYGFGLVGLMCLGVIYG